MSNPYTIPVLFFLYCLIYGLSILFSGPKPGRNPFSAGHVRPPKPLVTDRDLRKNVLRQSKCSLLEYFILQFDQI